MTATLRTPSGWIQIFIEDYSTSLNMSSNQAILRKGRVHYPFTPSQSILRLTLICPSADYRNRLQRLIRKSQEQALKTDGKVSDSTVLTWPDEKMHYRGFIKTVPGGSQKNDDYSTLEVEMVLVYDAFHTRRAQFSEADYEGVWDFEGQDLPEGFQPPLLPGATSTSPTQRLSILDIFNIRR